MKKKQPLVKRADDTKATIVVNQLNVQSADRSRKDISDWRTSHRAAESISNPNRTKLYDLYDDVLLDGHLTGIIGKRIAAVRNKQLVFKANKIKVDAFDNLINSNEFRKLVTLLMERKFWGVSGMEFLPGTKFEFLPIPRKHIKIEKGVISLHQGIDGDGVAYKDISNIWVVGESRDLGLLLKCSPYALWKKGNMADWAQYVEIFGQPVRVVKYDAYDLKTKMELQTVLDESGSSLALMIPKQADFEIKDGKGSNGDGQLQERLKKACDDEMSVIILGVTETTTSSKSSGYAQAETQSNQQLEITIDDMAEVLNLLNDQHFLNILASYGYPVANGRFEWVDEADLGKLKKRLEIDEKVAAKVPVADEYWYETYGIPKPANYEQLKQEQQAAKAAQEAGVKSSEGNNPTNNRKPNNRKPNGRAAKLSFDANDKLNWWERLRITLADFFDQALED